MADGGGRGKTLSVKTKRCMGVLEDMPVLTMEGQQGRGLVHACGRGGV